MDEVNGVDVENGDAVQDFHLELGGQNHQETYCGGSFQLDEELKVDFWILGLFFHYDDVELELLKDKII